MNPPGGSSLLVVEVVVRASPYVVRFFLSKNASYNMLYNILLIDLYTTLLYN